ncbi:MAG: hydroxymethylpyrimidine/phosphomethylpyrimidine kinase [Alteromonas macleodii]|jgi:hydroxymethylpyrimidine/phosphomethylpyrimidine kinase
MIQDVLSVVGSNPLVGVSIQAGIKAIPTNCAHPMAAINALTIQNTQRVSGINLVLISFAVDQINTLSSDFHVNEEMVSIIANADITQVVADVLWREIGASIILDWVIVAKVGALLSSDAAIATVYDALQPLAIISTLTISEAVHLLGLPQAITNEEKSANGRALCALGLRAVLMKGGHLDADENPNVLITNIGANWFNSPEVSSKNTHGTSCILLVTIGAQIAQGLNLPDAIGTPKTHVAAEFLQADQLYVGSGCDPIHHFANLHSKRKLKYETDIFDHRSDPVCIATRSTRSDDLDVGLVYQS